MRIAFLIFDNLTALDAIGPFEVMCRIPGAEVMFVGETAGIKRADPNSLGLVADYSIADVTSADILVVPGGRGEAQVREKPQMLEWVRQIDATTRWTTSVCTGALILGAAGLLKGRPATTHWARLRSCATSAPIRALSASSRTARSSRRPAFPPASTWRCISSVASQATPWRKRSRSVSSTTRSRHSTATRDARRRALWKSCGHVISEPPRSDDALQREALADHLLALAPQVVRMRQVESV